MVEIDKKCEHVKVKCLSCGMEGTIDQLSEDRHQCLTRPDVLKAILLDGKGASQWMIGTRSEIVAWEESWGDSENLSVTVTGKQGKQVGRKARGKSEFTWEAEEK